MARLLAKLQQMLEVKFNLQAKYKIRPQLLTRVHEESSSKFNHILLREQAVLYRVKVARTVLWILSRQSLKYQSA